MRVGVIDAVNIGANLARQWSRRGHDILLRYKRDTKQLEALASELGTRWGEPKDAAAHGEAVLLATAYPRRATTAWRLGRSSTPLAMARSWHESLSHARLAGQARSRH
jgi:predicted dinucleotide-binding enzyme